MTFLPRILAQHLDSELSRSWSFADRGERRRRLNFVIQLSVELDAIRKVSVFCCRLGESAIEAIILGDRVLALDCCEHFTFVEEGNETRERYAPLWSNFVRILRAAASDA
jgi:hypothetical protein